MKEKTDYKKDCPSCNQEQFYSRIDVLELALKNNSICRKCSSDSQIGIPHNVSKQGLIKLKELGSKPMSVEIKNKISATLKGKKKSKEHVEKVRNALKGQVISLESRIKNSNSNKGRISPWKGKHHTEETKYKLRLATIEDLRKKGVLVGKNSSKNFNLKACDFINNLNMLVGLDLQHALNGSEVELYGYFVDGYDKDKNIIFEYDEKRHNERYWKNKDVIRQQNLINNIHPTLFLRYDEQWNRLYDVETLIEIQIL